MFSVITDNYAENLLSSLNVEHIFGSNVARPVALQGLIVTIQIQIYII